LIYANTVKSTISIHKLASSKHTVPFYYLQLNSIRTPTKMPQQNVSSSGHFSSRLMSASSLASAFNRSVHHYYY